MTQRKCTKYWNPWHKTWRHRLGWIQASLRQIGISTFLGGILGNDETSLIVIPFMLLRLPISVDRDTCPVKHTPCGNGVTSPIVLYKHNVPESLPPHGPGSLRSDRLQFTSSSVTELMTSDLSNTAINACYLENKMIVFIFQRTRHWGSPHWHVNVLLGLDESFQTGMLIYLNWSGSCSYKKVLDICWWHKLL